MWDLSNRAIKHRIRVKNPISEQVQICNLIKNLSYSPYILSYDVYTQDLMLIKTREYTEEAAPVAPTGRPGLMRSPTKKKEMEEIDKISFETINLF